MDSVGKVETSAKGCNDVHAHSPDNIIDIVNVAYSSRAREGVQASYAQSVAAAFGYTEEQLHSVPEGSHMGLSCGNPVATASIKKGEVVVDLGSGGGIDVFLAASAAGPTGRVIGLDMSQDMIDLARKNASKKGLKPPQVSFVKASLTESLPIESNSVDCILSNCVVNLLPQTGKVSLLKEVYRILKPGGRVVLDDIMAKKALPDEIKNDLASYVACISGAVQVDDYKNILQTAGLTNVLFVDTKNNLNIYYQSSTSTSSCCAPSVPGPQTTKPNYDVNEWVASYQIYALKDGDPIATPSKTLLRWWDAYPAPKATPEKLTADEVASLIRGNSASATPAAYAVIDVRKDDHAGGHVLGSHNWFAQSFYDDLPTFYEKFKDTPRVIFYCQSSNGRGPRAAAMYQDYLDAHEGEHNSTAFVLGGGIKNWMLTFKGQDGLIDYD